MYPYNHDNKCWFLVATILLCSGILRAEAARSVIPLEDNWKTWLQKTGADSVFYPEKLGFDDTSWKTVSIPHNWDGYEGFSQAKHGNLHGTAWYRTAFRLDSSNAARRIFLFFEGVGSYARVFINGKLAGKHSGGLTTFTLDITDLVNFRNSNILAVEAHHPAHIRNLPWVCGGCELALGFSEGPQPFGIFRPVSIIITDPLRISPFGIHAWNDTSISEESATLQIRSEVSNHGKIGRSFLLDTRLETPGGDVVFECTSEATLTPGESVTISQASPSFENPILWSPDRPFLYNLVSEIRENDRLIDRVETPYGIRWIEWPDIEGETDQPLRINGKPFFINGVADYEHLLGQTHAFTDEQVKSRVAQVESAGFNAFRDAHHPHNLRFNQHWDKKGILWWTQFGAHIWFDREDFQENYKRLLGDWVRERRNSPSLILYGLQNESKLPEKFASECADIIRELDPTASIQRLITTCNGGTGTDWDIPQNWSGTYGGNLQAYSKDLRRQRLVGEYGAWRSLGLHTEGGYIEDGLLSEDRMTALMETKVRLAEEVRDKVVGHFSWPLTTHQNPGRNVGSRGQQAQDGIRGLDRIGPANNKGLFSIWGEPLDAFYMYRGNYAPADKEPMAYIVSHTWPDRWTKPGLKKGIIVYSNCDEVELFNGFRTNSLGIRRRGKTGTHFQWDGVNISTNVLYAEGRIDGQTVATDLIQLHHLPEDPALKDYDPDPSPLTNPHSGYHYFYRVNAGGPDYTDQNGNLWQADTNFSEGNAWGSRSWARRFPNLVPMFGSRRLIFDPVLNTADDPLFQSFRYGRDELDYIFTVPEGDYLVDLFFMEPWYGTGGGMDCTGWRLFDVAVNGVTMIRDLDLWKEAGRATAFRKTLRAASKNGKIVVSFPRVQSNQAVISAISIASEQDPGILGDNTDRLISDIRVHPEVDGLNFNPMTWLDTGISRLSDVNDNLSFVSWELRETEWIQMPDRAKSSTVELLLGFTITDDADVFIVHDRTIGDKPNWLQGWTRTPMVVNTVERPNDAFQVYSRRFSKGDSVNLGSNGSGIGSTQIYSVIVKRRYPPPPSRIVGKFSVSNSLRPEGWQALGNFRSGQDIYSDGGPVIARFTSRLSDCDWIRSPQADASNPLVQCSFTTTEHVEVFVALHPEVRDLPGWLRGWSPTSYELTTAEPEVCDYKLLKKRFDPGEVICLGPNGSGNDKKPLPMYSIILRTVRAEVTYEAEDLVAYQSLQESKSSDFTGSGYVNLGKLEENSFDWIIQVGVGDRYGLNFHYQSSSPESVLTTALVIAPDGQVLCEEALEFPPSPAGSWKISGFRTCDSINAGTYTIRLKGDSLRFLKFDSLVVE